MDRMEMKTCKIMHWTIYELEAIEKEEPNATNR